MVHRTPRHPARQARAAGYRHLLYLPEDYARSRRRWPLLLFLHGSDERGTNLEWVKRHGPPKFLDDCRDFPMIVLSPQCPRGRPWSPPALRALLDEAASRYRVDPRRVYVTGLSMGGFGTWALALAFPFRFAAIAPICGGGNPRLAARLKHLPVWAFHGANDDVVPVERSARMVEALRQCGGQARFTVYPDAGHDSWTATYANPELYDWFLAHRQNHRDRERPVDATGPRRNP